MSALSSATSTRPVRGPGTAGTTSPASSGSQRSASLTKGVTAPDTAGAPGGGGAGGGGRGGRGGERGGGQVRGAQGQRDGEGGADVGRAVDRDVAAVQADELAHHRQADAAAPAGGRAGAGDGGAPPERRGDTGR